MVLALSIPDTLAFKEVIVTLVFGVVLLSIFLQGLSMIPLMRLIGFISPLDAFKAYEVAKTEVALMEDSLDAIDHMKKRRLLHAQSAQKLQEEFSTQLQDDVHRLDKMEPDKEAMLTEEVLRAKRRLLMEQKEKLIEMYQNGGMSFESYETVRMEIDSKLLELENMGTL